ncbi:MAG: hypothetical protein PVH73_10380 [Candidatus Bathyarchaeota archaeon]
MVVKETTIVLGINFGDYVLVASDTRITYYNRDGSINRYNDDSGKIQETQIGLITGAGSVQLLEMVEKRLKVMEVTTSNQIIEIIEKARIDYQRRSWRDVTRYIEMTGWLFTYRTFIDSKPKLRLCVVHPSVGEKMAAYEDNHPALICPVEAVQEEADAIGAALLELTKPSKDFASLSESIQYHYRVVATLIRELHPKYPSISSYLQVGIHTIDGLRDISPVIKDEGSVTFHLH